MDAESRQWEKHLPASQVAHFPCLLADSNTRPENQVVMHHLANNVTD